MPPSSHPAALQAPATAATIIDDALLAEVIAASRTSPRRRMVLPLHKGSDAPVQRMLNAIQPESRIRPHRHSAPKSETFLVLRGAFLLFLFTDDGTVNSIHRLSPGQACGVDLEPGIWHTLVALEEDSIILEAKPGPWLPGSELDGAPWAPPEESDEAEEYRQKLLLIADNYFNEK